MMITISPVLTLICVCNFATIIIFVTKFIVIKNHKTFCQSAKIPLGELNGHVE